MTAAQGFQRSLGRVFIGAVSGTMILAGSVKLAGLLPHVFVEMYHDWRLIPYFDLIAAVEIGIGLLLIRQSASSAATALASAFWGGVVALYLSNQCPILVPTTLLLMTWAGAYLRSRESGSRSFSHGKVAS